MRRKSLLFIMWLVGSICSYAQMPALISADFKAIDSYGNNCWYKITDATNRYVELWPNKERYEGSPGSGVGDASIFAISSVTRLPATVVNGGVTYYVKNILPLAWSNLSGNSSDTLIISEGIEHLEWEALMWCGGKVVVLPSTMKRLEPSALRENWQTEKFLGLENTQIERLEERTFTQCSKLSPSFVWKLPPTLRYLGRNSLPIPHWQRVFELPASVDTIEFDFVDEAGAYYSGAEASRYTNYLKVIKCPRFTPPHVNNVSASTAISTNGKVYYNAWGPYGMFSAQQLTGHNAGAPSYAYIVTDAVINTPDSLYVPVDATAGYENAAGWSMYKGKYFEELKMSSKNYVSYYLENENFVVPAGCTAYVVKGRDLRTNPLVYDADVAQVITCNAGDVIPKQTGFILEGAAGMAGKTVAYQANSTATEVSTTGHWMIGTANKNGEEFNDSQNYVYFIFGDGDFGPGFYPQGTRAGKSVKLRAHQAGLRIPKSSSTPAKAFVIDFEAAKNNTTTAIRSVGADETTSHKPTVVYDLQGRRVTNPAKGIYIVNGKKVIR